MRFRHDDSWGTVDASTQAVDLDAEGDVGASVRLSDAVGELGWDIGIRGITYLRETARTGCKSAGRKAAGLSEADAAEVKELCWDWASG